ncbi:MAG: ribonuclease E/G [Alphaproteobacteria bacterium]|nr:ribonuclease E/G [Alphaproteobacteria bacterium]
MGKQMLIDASHPEESRVAILSSDRLEEFDFETTTKKQLKGNIYLAKVIRIEPSLQAAFVEFGGNRHGFLAFNEIHPDYYRVPVEDREALTILKEDDSSLEEPFQDNVKNTEVEILGGEDVEEIEDRPHRPRPLRQYKIQEVIKRRQVMLVQVVKEERGGKGAALTTYLSLAGRYCVLMPNAAKGGGISRKITNMADRKRLREIIESIELPDTMSLIIRTAGMARSKVEIKRDSDYLMRLWNEIREKTLHSIAPALIYEESDLIKRAIRDYYTRDIEEIWIEGEEGFREAKDFIRKLMPSHVKKVKLYKDDRIPLFHRYGVEQQIDAMHNPIVQLRAGGYIVFGTTEALVAIDVNSGKATRERHIEETAFKTNLEAAEEIARQLRLRDLAGLVVIDFIDMDDSRNIEAVERRLKDTMRHDRARVQVGRISAFGLLELSRQRLRPNIIESTSLPCLSCRGTGMIRSVESSSLHVLRAIEEEAIQQKLSEILVYVPTSIALYILNHKRKTLLDIEARWKISVNFSKDDVLIPPDYRIERVRLRREPFMEEVPSLLIEEKEEGTRGREMTSQTSSQVSKRRRSGRDRFGSRHHDRRERTPLQENQNAVLSEPPLEGKVQKLSKEDGEQFGINSEAQLQPTLPEGESSRSKPRRRFRKFERRPHKAGTQVRAQPATLQTSEGNINLPPKERTELATPRSPESLEKSKVVKANIKKMEPKKVEEKPSESPSERKKATSRKGWWQRLLE